MSKTSIISCMVLTYDKFYMDRKLITINAGKKIISKETDKKLSAPA